jgi:hypothetical protein
MHDTALSQLEDDVLLRRLAALVAQDRRTTAALLAHVAEVDDRHLYLKMGFDSMQAYCVRELHMSDAAARRRIHAAHTARRFPPLLDAVADGRLHLSAIALLSARFTTTNVDELIAAATHKTVGEIERLLVERWPQAEELRLDDGVIPQVVVPQRQDAVPRFLKSVVPESLSKGPAVRTEIAPLSPERFTVHMSIEKVTHDKLRRAQDLLGHTLSSREVAAVFDRALDALLEKLEKRKVGTGKRLVRVPALTRTIQASVKRAVWERDGGRCSFVGDGGRRCQSTDRLEFDHIVPIARGGDSSIANVRVLCHAHNQFAAEEAFGREFMDRVRKA